MKCNQCHKRNATRGAVCSRCLARRVRVLRRYAERWDERCAREVARWSRTIEAIDRDADTRIQLMITDGLLALNAITYQSTGASIPSVVSMLDWRALRLLCRDSAGVDELALRASLRASGMSLRDALQSTAPFALRELARLYRGRLA